MKRKVFLLLLLTCLLPVTAMRAQSPDVPVTPRCTADEAVWGYNYEAFLPTNFPKSGWQKHTAAKARTQTWSCTVNGNVLVVRFYFTHPLSRCSADSNIYTSAWVNGVKVISREDAGEAPECFGGEMLQSVSLRGGKAEVCRLSWKEPLADDPKRMCERLSANKIAGMARDPKYIPPGTVTPWAYELHYGSREFCEQHTFRLTPVSWRDLSAPDPAFLEFAVPGTKTWMNAEVGRTYDDMKYGSDSGAGPLSAEFDADNDGILDVVSLYAVGKKEGRVMAELRWQRKGSTGKPFVAGEIGSDENGIFAPEKYVTDTIAQLIRPVRIDGKTYLYARRHQAYESEDGGEDLFAISDSQTSVIRGLIELHPDGKSTLKCGWGLRPHPEEFL